MLAEGVLADAMCCDDVRASLRDERGCAAPSMADALCAMFVFAVDFGAVFRRANALRTSRRSQGVRAHRFVDAAVDGRAHSRRRHFRRARAHRARTRNAMRKRTAKRTPTAAMSRTRRERASMRWRRNSRRHAKDQERLRTCSDAYLCPCALCYSAVEGSDVCRF